MNRNEFLQCCTAAFGGMMFAGCRQSPRRPNIILFLVDDMGWQDTSVAFHSERTIWNELYRTPNMQRLADRGTKFTNAYAASPVCSPTRVSMMTGKNPARTNITDWVGHGIYGNRYVEAPDWEADGLQPGQENTLPEILRENGYRTIHIGKGHFGGSGTPGAIPTNLGFDVSIGGSRPGSPDGSYFLPWDATRFPGLEDYPDGTYINDALTQEAINQIDQAAADNVPFFMNMAHYAVHTPIVDQGDPAYLDQYSDRPDPEDDYAALLASMDASLGAILDNLEDKGIAEDTLIVFFSDNGGLSNHTRNADASYTTESGTDFRYERDKHSTPINSGKGSAYEGGVRVPMIVAWAGQDPAGAALQDSLPIQPGSQSDCPVISDDLLPTFLTIAGLTNMEAFTREIDGVDLTPLLRDSDSRLSDRAIYFHYPHQWYRDVGVGLGIQPFTAMRKGEWKLIYFYGDGHKDGEGLDPWFELYNLEDDIGETTSLVQSFPDVARSMAQEMRDWMTEVGAQTPVNKATSLPVPLPLLEVL